MTLNIVYHIEINEVNDIKYCLSNQIMLINRNKSG